VVLHDVGVLQADACGAAEVVAAAAGLRARVAERADHQVERGVVLEQLAVVAGDVADVGAGEGR
jgi:hypothetical protein